MISTKTLIKKDLLFISVFLTTLTIVLLASIDFLFVTIIEGYQTTGAFFLPFLIVLMSIYSLLWCGQRFGWPTLLPYMMYGTGVFFPHIILTALASFYFGMPSHLEEFYLQNYCVEETVRPMCGQALAHLVFCGVIRALPLLFVVPSVFFSFYRYNIFHVRDMFQPN